MNGILSQTIKAKKLTEEENLKEILQMIIVESLDRDGKIDYDLLRNNLNQLEDIEGVPNQILESDFPLIIKIKNMEVEISKNGEIFMTKPVEDTTPNSLSGDGTNSNPYLVESIEDIITLANSVNSGEIKYNQENIEIKLNTNLNFKSINSYISPDKKVSYIDGKIVEDDNGIAIIDFLREKSGFKPIGNSENPFESTFDGNGHYLNGIYINSSAEEIAFVGYNNGTIKNLQLSGNIIGKKFVAGFVVVNYGDINNCTNNVAVTSQEWYAGGITAVNYGIVEKCINNSKVEADVQQGGGISGQNGANGMIRKSANYGTITGDAYIGGISGKSNGGSFEEVFNAGIVVGNNHYVGGIVGYFNSNDGDIINCYNKGNVNGVFNTDAFYSGSSVDRNIAYNSYNIGKIETTGTIDRLVPKAEETINSYYLEESVNKTIMNKKTSQEMKSNEFLDLLNNGTHVWKKDSNNINNGYPILGWQEEE